MTVSRLVILILVGLFLSFCAYANAHEGHFPCEVDQMAFCGKSSTEAGHCLRSRIPKLSRRCREYFVAEWTVQDSRWEKERAHCRTDAARLCDDEHFDEHLPVAQCLLDHPDQLSRQCKNALNRLRPSITELAKDRVSASDKAQYEALRLNPPSNIQFLPVPK